MNTATKKPLAGVLALLALAASPWAAAEVKATDGWLRATPPGTKVAAGYLTLINTGDEERKLLKIVSTVSDQVTVHRSSIDEKGQARMWPLALLAVPAGGTLRMEPGGVHVMFNALDAPLVAGQKVPLTLKFDGGQPEFTVMLEVRPLVPAAKEHEHQH